MGSVSIGILAMVAIPKCCAVNATTKVDFVARFGVVLNLVGGRRTGAITDEAAGQNKDEGTSHLFLEKFIVIQCNHE